MSDRPGQASKVHSISCTDLEWVRIKERSQRRGLSVSRYCVERALSGNPTGAPPSPLVLSEAQQRELYEQVGRIEARTLAATDAMEPLTERVRDAVAFLVEARMREMVRDGRAGEMGEIAADVLGAAVGPALVESFQRREKRHDSD